MRPGALFLIGAGLLLGLALPSVLGAIRPELGSLVRRLQGRGSPPAPSLSDYRQLPCPADPLAIATFGQSNSANSVLPLEPLKIPVNLLQFNWRNGRCYAYREPLIATDGTGGNPLTPAVVALAASTQQPLVVIPFGRGGSSIADWAYGYLSHQHDVALKAMHQAGLRSPIVLWHQGESDAAATTPPPRRFEDVPPFSAPDPGQFRLGTRQADYEQALRRVIARTRSVFPDSRFGVAVASVCTVIGSQAWAPVQRAQRQVAQSEPGAFLSADSDRIPTQRPYRYDGCHFAPAGARALSEQYLQSLSTHLGPETRSTPKPPASVVR
ncbi:MAG: hypothetical protein NTW83_05325 [Cyanobacteria bacterium]|nr:hypothetical protein [Cyanobacteriota bacterium]